MVRGSQLGYGPRLLRGTVPDRLLVVSADDPPFALRVMSMLKPIAARIKSTITALPIHMMRISPIFFFFFGAGHRFLLFSGVRLDLSRGQQQAVQRHSAGLHIEGRPERANCHLYITPPQPQSIAGMLE
jgi:hypothetical protein